MNIFLQEQDMRPLDLAASTEMARAETTNRLLRLLPPQELSALLKATERVELRPRQVLQHWKLSMDHIYFVESGLVSVAAKVDSENFVEVWLVGSDGCAGLPLMLGTPVAPLHRRVVQAGGTALRVRVPALHDICQRLPVLQMVLNHYVAFLLAQTSQCAACNLRHTLKQRLARWLLLARGRLNADEIPLTHDVIARLLGVRRASITDRLQELQAESLISTRRRFIRIERASELEHLSCGCSGLIELEYHRQVVCSAAAATAS